ncbi:hypothetical protein [uncultured Bacteroides sp.]|uniref:hypothetical protein n=1 Tax=uncultured Bacteroides sp. TaxID=162156 RepID=UPI002AA790B1|nr:hypothetical protein [uncultured Bacteroides sp.]
MRKRHIISFLFCCILASVSGQTLEQAKALFLKGEYAKAKPVFKKYVQSQPSSANYNYWYGVCCLKTDAPQEALPHLELAAKRKIQNAPLYMGESYNALYRFEDAVKSYEEYIDILNKKKLPTDEAEQLLAKAKNNARMLKGVEDVCIIDSFVVDKAHFLDTYKLNEESGKLFTYNDYFKQEGKNEGTVYETEIGNKVYYSERGKNNALNIVSKNKMLDKWGDSNPLSASINGNGNSNYPFVLTDGTTLYFANDGEASMGGYDIFVTRYNTDTDDYLTPENVGMPFNSPYNDYMYAIDEYNELGWFASDRYQPENKVCIYVFIPNASKRIYNYEATDPDLMLHLAQLHALKETWKDKGVVKEAKERLKAAINHQPRKEKAVDFEFVINNDSTYYSIDRFKSPEAKTLFLKYQQMSADYFQQTEKLNAQRQSYAEADKTERLKMAPAILDLEKRTQEMSQELDTLAINARNKEIMYIKKQ